MAQALSATLDGTAREAIYGDLAVTLPGPADSSWGRRP